MKLLGCTPCPRCFAEARRGFLCLLLAVAAASAYSCFALADQIERTATIGGKPYAVAINHDDNLLLVTDLQSNQILFLDPRTLAPVADSIAVGADPSGIVCHPDGTKAYASVRNGTVVAISLVTYTADAVIPISTEGRDIAISSDGNRLYVTGYNSVAVVSTATQTEVGVVDVVGTAMGIDVSSDGSRAYVALHNERAVAVIDTSTNSVVSLIEDVGDYPIDVAVSPTGDRVYVTVHGQLYYPSWGGYEIAIIDAVTNTHTATISVGGQPAMIVLTPDGRYAYFTVSDDDCVRAIATETLSWDHTKGVSTGSSPWGIDVAPDGRRLYVANYNDGTLSVVLLEKSYEIGLVGHTLPGIPGDADGWSIGLDWWLGEIPDEGGRPDENSGLNWDQLDGYGFSLYRDDQPEEVFRAGFYDLGGAISVELWKPGEAVPRYEHDFDDYRTRYGEGEGKRATFCGLFDKWTEFEDYSATDGEYSYRVSLWYGSPDNEISSSDPITVTAGEFAWGVVARDAQDLGDPLLREQYNAIWSLQESGLEYCKFWLHGNVVEFSGNVDLELSYDFKWENKDLPYVNWMGSGDPSASSFDQAVDEYAFPETYEDTLRWGGDFPNDPSDSSFQDSYDSFIERLNSKGVSPVPWIGHGDSMPAFWPTVSFLSTSTMNEYLTRLYVHTRAASRRYRYGLHRIPLWNLENELNWTFLWRSVPPTNELQWINYDFVTNVYRALSLAVEHENWHDVRWDKPVTYARRTTNFNIHSNELGSAGLLFTAMTLGPMIASIVESNVWLTQSLEEFIQDWEGFFDIIGLGAYPNYVVPQPKADILLWNAVQRARAAVPDKPVMVLEAGYPKGYPENPQAYESLEWQQTSIAGLASSAYRNSADGFFYFTLFSDCPEYCPANQSSLKWVERYWGLLEASQSSESAPWSRAFDTYLGIIANPDSLPSDPPSPLVDVQAGVVALQNGIIEIIDGISIEIDASVEIPDTEIALVVGSLGGPLTAYGLATYAFLVQTGMAPVTVADIRLITSIELGPVEIGLSIDKEELGGQDPAEVRLHFHAEGSELWQELSGQFFVDLGATLQFFGSADGSELGGTVVCLGAPVASPAVFRVDNAGNVLADQTFYGAAFETGAADIAEWVSVSELVEPGDVVKFDPMAPGQYRMSQNVCSSLVAGVISTIPGVTLGRDLDASEKALLALIGIVPVKVTDEGGPIQPGDLLVASSTPGHAMRWAGPDPCLCSLVGKALEPMGEEQGVILVLLTAH